MASAAPVRSPTIDALVGEKLTAFAPETTGIPYRRRTRSMSLAINKQLYDIAVLFTHISSLRTVRDSFAAAVATESRYRRNLSTSIDVAIDAIGTALTVSTDGRAGTGDWEQLRTGIQQLRSYVFSELYC